MLINRGILSYIDREIKASVDKVDSDSKCSFRFFGKFSSNIQIDVRDHIYSFAEVFLAVAMGCSTLLSTVTELLLNVQDTLVIF